MTTNKYTVRIKNIDFENIKGLKSFKRELAPRQTYGFKNGFGKSTILDTIMWLLTGQTDVHGRKFDPTPTNAVTTKISQKAAMTITVNGIEHNLEISRPTLTGTLEYYVDGIKYGKNDYVDKLNEFGLKEVLLVANPFHVLSYLTWQEARDELTRFITMPTRAELEAELTKKNIGLGFAEVIEALAMGESIGWSAESLKSKLATITGSIDTYALLLEAEKAKFASMETSDLNIDQLKAIRETLLEDREKALRDSSVTELLETIKVKNELRNMINDGIRQVTNRIYQISDEKIKLGTELSNAEKEAKKLFDEGNIESAKQFNEQCSYCGQKLNEEHIHKMHEVKNTKVQNLMAAYQTKLAEVNVISARVTNETLALTNEATTLQNQHQALTVKLDEVNSELTRLNNDVSAGMSNDEVIKIDARIAEINRALSVDTSSVKQQIEKLATDLAEAEAKKMRFEFVNSLLKMRLQLIATISADKLKNYFEGITIELEKTLKNGKVEPVFTVSIDGVQYKDLNTASKLKAGLIFATGLQKLTGLDATILIDNFEGIDDINQDTIVQLVPSFISMAVSK